MKKIIYNIGMILLVTVWASLALFAWIKPAGESSESERRPLAQAPAVNTDTVLDGSFMEDFESYTLDQFPLRDDLRQLKALFHYNLLGQRDNNGIYIVNGYAAQLEYPLNTDALDYGLGKLQGVYEKYLKGTDCSVCCAVIPDKGYYLAEANDYPAMDYNALFEKVKSSLPDATHVTLTGCLSIEDYYRTDTHWRQEKLLPAAQKLCEAMGVTPPKAVTYTQTALERPFYGVYYGQAALPMEPETMYIMESDLLSGCQVYNYETGKYAAVYDMDKLAGKDLYEVYLSGPRSLLRIENPNAATDKELVVFRDSFG
ncbi:MAG: hypothetical protein IJZ56_03645, partial [Oscillospiraceae bacterium]|nr:hypothetical protein [Oscillospiraceae bacterium]